MSQKRWTHCVDGLPSDGAKCFVVARRLEGTWDCSFAVWKNWAWITCQGDPLADGLEKEARSWLGDAFDDCSHFRRLEKIYWAEVDEFDNDWDSDAALDDFLGKPRSE